MIIWNALHCRIHNVDADAACNKALPNCPTKYITVNNPYVKWVVQNHQAHHLYKGREKGNWNVVIPGADYILGSHNKLGASKSSHIL